MAQYLAPGVYVEEVSSGSAPIAGVSTSIAGFIGIVSDNVEMPSQPGKFKESEKDEKGNPILIPILYEVADANDPQLITSWQGFKTKFGDFHAGNQILAHAVYGFFNNGGARCWVTRVNGANGNQSADNGASGDQPNESQATLTTDQVSKALESFEPIDEITIVAVPGVLDTSIQSAVMDHCENMGDRFAILDGQQNPKSLTPSEIQGQVRDSNYAALYYPWIKVYDPVTKRDDYYVAPSGHLAGIYARSDEQRGVHKAPANEVIRGAIGVQKRLRKADQAGLNPVGINIIRQFNGNVTVWGARTLGGDKNGEWKYINVRRLFLYLRQSIEEGTQWAVFEPNGEELWAKIRRNITAFLTTVWRDGALFGATPEQAFFVRCDETTNPPEVRDLGQVVTEIGVAVIKPAEFVIFRISQWAGPGG